LIDRVVVVVVVLPLPFLRVCELLVYLVRTTKSSRNILQPADSWLASKSFKKTEKTGKKRALGDDDGSRAPPPPPPPFIIMP
jgi:hypothetical protein